MDRQIVYPGGIPLDTDILTLQRNVMTSLGYLAQAVLGTGAVADGLACLPTIPASMSITIGPGSITQFGVVDTLPYGSLPAEPAEPLLRIAASVIATGFTLTAPTGSGQAINYLIEANLLEQDATPVVLPYYNASNPAQPYSGPGNTGTPQNTQRLQQVQLQVKAGAPGPVGTQQTPSVDAGWAGLYVVTVTSGQTSIVSTNIVALPNAPFIHWKLPQQTPGTKNLVAFTPVSQGNWIAPAGISSVRLRLWAGGGAGGSGLSGAGGGGGGGGYSEGYYAVTPGQSYFAAVGNGGVGAGTAGGPSSFGVLASSTGGQAGANGASNTGGAGGTGGTAVGSTAAIAGQIGGTAFLAGSAWVSGDGGGAFYSAGANAIVASASGATDGHAATMPGAGGAGGIGSGLGGQGGPGLILLEW